MTRRSGILFSGLVLLSALSTTSCRTTKNTSEEKALPNPTTGNLTPEAWIEACNKELANPESGAASREDLKALANTESCADAYPEVKRIFDLFAKKAKTNTSVVH